jgi:sarcosine oxidase subunit beta
MGASTAFHLARQGVRNLILVEREPFLGMGSTGRNAGGVRHQFSHEANVRLSIESIRMLEHFHDEVGHQIDFHQDGYLFLLSDAKTLNAFEVNVDLQRRLGIQVDLLTPEEAAALAPGLRVDSIIGATFCARDGIADPNGVTMGFAKGAQAMGVEILRDTLVTGIRVDGGKIRGVETTAGEIATPCVVNAAGPHAQEIGQMAGVQIPVSPYRRHIFITEPVPSLDPTGAPSVPSNRIMVIDFESTFYFHREGAGILFGMSDPDEPSGYDTSVRWEFLEKVTPIAINRLPILSELGIAHAWAGLYEMTPDAMPIIGACQDVEGFYMINGFSGHGFQHSPAAGRILADIITGHDPAEATPFSFERFRTGASSAEANVV